MTDPIKTAEATKTLTIDLSEEYKIKIEEPKDLEKSFFADIYKNAANAVREIITQTEKKIKDDKDPFLNQHQDYNNIIAFCGERGTGKSSAMISFAQSLLKIESIEALEFYGKEQEVIKRRYQTLKVIDPSLFEEDENIFEVILAQLFSSFEIALKGKEKDSDIDQKRKLLEQFEKVYENLQTIKKNGQKYDGEALETLSKLACGANLRENFKELVNRYLKFITEDDKEKKHTYLLIPIDDFDLNVKAAAEMAEQIRKYLMIPNVIVLMAVKIEQLSDAKEQQVRKKFKTLIKANALNDTPEEITLKYVFKLIPNNRRIEMPLLGSSIGNTRLTIKNLQSTSNYESIFIGFQSECYNKARLFITSKEFADINVFPQTLREIKEYFITLNKIQSEHDFINFLIKQLKGRTQQHSQIIDKFLALPNREKNYFLIKSIVEDLVSYTNTGKRNLSTTLDITPQKANYFNIILDSENKSYNITLGDLLFFFSVVSESKYGLRYKDFLNLFKLIYTILLTSAKMNNNLGQIHEITNGSIYEPYYREVIRSQRKVLRSKFAINNFGLIKINGSTLNGAFSNKLTQDSIRLIEWLSYFIEYPINSKHQIYTNDTDSLFYFKDDVVPFYKREMDIGRGSILKEPIFNVLQIITNSLIPKQNFKRAFNSYYSNLKNKKNDEYFSYARKSFIWEMLEWQKQFGLILPINNIFLYESIISQIDPNLRIGEEGFHSFIVFLFNQIKNILENINKEEPLLKDQKIAESFTACPIIKPIFENKDNNPYLLLLDQLKSNPQALSDQHSPDSMIIQAINSLKRLSSKKSILKAINNNRQIYDDLELYNYFINKINQGINPTVVKDEIIAVLKKKINE